MIFALLVALFSIIAVVVGKIAYESGWDAGYDLGFDDSQGEVDTLQSRVDTLSSLLASANDQSDFYKRRLKLSEFVNKVLSSNLTKTEADREKTAKLLGDCIVYCNTLADLVIAFDMLAGQAVLKETEDQNHIDGLTVDLAMAEHERDEAKAMLEKIMSVKMPVKVAAELSRIIKAQ